jgi:hypothetical protein
MTSTIGQRTKTYLGLGPDKDGLTTATGRSVRQQLAIAGVWLLVGVLIWSFWSASIGSWMVLFGLIMLVVVPLVRHRQRKADRRDFPG